MSHETNVRKDFREMAKLIIGENDLKTLFPDLSEEWDYDKNTGLSPESFRPGSNVRVWWRCKTCRRSWRAVISNRTRGTACPFCSKTRLKPGENDLQTIRPDIAAEWDYSKNDGSPSEYTYGNGQKVWWKCKRCGYVWLAKINNRTNGSGCPKCSRYTHTSFAEQVVFFYIKECFADAENSYKADWLGKGEIDIYVPSEKLAIEYDGTHWHKKKESDDIRKSKLILEHGIRLIRIRESGCPEMPDLCRVITTSAPTGTGAHLVPSLNELFRTIKGMGILLVSEPDINIERDRQKILAQYAGAIKEHSIAVACPDILSEWNYDKNGLLNPENISAHSSQKVWWICRNCGTEWSQIIASRANGFGCPKCAAQRRADSFRKSIVEKRGSLAQSIPILLDEWDYTNNTIKPNEITSRANTKVWWVCKNCGNKWQMTVAARAEGSGCPKCGHKKAANSRVKTLLEHGQSFGELRPDLTKEIDVEKNDEPIDPYAVLPYSRKVIWWKCAKCGQSWEASFSSRFASPNCSFCSTQKRVSAYKKAKLLKYGSLLETKPELLLEWDYSKNQIDPKEVTAGSKDLAWWKCSLCGYVWKTAISNRTKKDKTGCPKCANRKRGMFSRARDLIPGTNDLLSDNPGLCQEWDYDMNAGLRPENCTKSSGLKVWWRCKTCHGAWQATIANRNMSHSGCPYCTNKRALIGYNDLAHKFPQIAQEWSKQNSPLQPEEVVFSSHRKVSWLCSECGMTWSSEVRARTQHNAKCPYCKTN